MQSTQNLINIEQALAIVLQSYRAVYKIEEAIHQAGGTAYIVGGAVRDMIMGFPVNDLDIEVHDVPLAQLENILSSYGMVSYIGKSFGVLKIAGLAIDWSLPRTDAAGRKPTVMVNPSMGIVEALRRRDLTMNALAINIRTRQLIDPFNGITDIQYARLRSPDIEFFKEDPLRFYRVMSFISRFAMEPDDVLENTCKTMTIDTISRERIEGEFEKLFLKSQQPSLGIRWLSAIGRLAEILPQLADTIGIPQEPAWHPEGDVFEHLMQTIDAVPAIAVSSARDKLTLSYAALCHDLGKVSTTVVEKGRIRSPGHAEAGVPLARKLLRRITRKSDLIEAVCLLVKYHMQPGQFINLNSQAGAYRRLALKLAKYTNLEMLLKLVLADRRGRNPKEHKPLTLTPDFIEEFIKRARQAQVFEKPEEAILHGRDIIDIVAPGPLMGELLSYVYKMQLDHHITDKHTLRELAIKELARLTIRSQKNN